MGAVKKQDVEWKDTFTFKCFPEYEYTRAQDARLILFQGRVEHYRAVINFADKFDDPNMINLVYMIGYDSKMRDYVLKTKNNVVVLCAKIPRETLKAYDDFWEMAKRLCKMGLMTADGELVRQDLDACYEEHKLACDDYDDVVKRINKCYERYTIIDKLHPEKTIDHKDLDKIIKRYFPLGREQCKPSETSYGSLTLISKAIECGLGGRYI